MEKHSGRAYNITNLTQGFYQLVLAALLSGLFSRGVIEAVEVLSGPGDEWALMWTLLQVTLMLGVPLVYFELKKTGSIKGAFFEHYLNVIPISLALIFPIRMSQLSLIYLGLGIYNLVQYFDGWRWLAKRILKRSLGDVQKRRSLTGQTTESRAEERPSQPSAVKEKASPGVLRVKISDILSEELLVPVVNKFAPGAKITHDPSDPKIMKIEGEVAHLRELLEKRYGDNVIG